MEADAGLPESVVSVPAESEPPVAATADWSEPPVPFDPTPAVATETELPPSAALTADGSELPLAPVPLAAAVSELPAAPAPAVATETELPPAGIRAAAAVSELLPAAVPSAAAPELPPAAVAVPVVEPEALPPPAAGRTELPAAATVTAVAATEPAATGADRSTDERDWSRADSNVCAVLRCADALTANSPTTRTSVSAVKPRRRRFNALPNLDTGTRTVVGEPAITLEASASNRGQQARLGQNSRNLR